MGWAFQSNDLHQNANQDSEKTSETPSIVWSRDLNLQDGDENSSSRSPTTENEYQRPDSGVGESVSTGMEGPDPQGVTFASPQAELLSESPSLGDLCHAKNTLRLSLNLSPGSEPPSHTETDETTLPPNITQILFANVDDDGATNTADASKLFDTILPTPSCTGSMDSLSSSSGSSDHRPPSFTTFGKKLNNGLIGAGTAMNSSSVSDSDYGSMKIPSIVLIEDCEPQSDDGLLVVAKKYGGANKLNRSTAARLSDSTDEDSGIENMTRLTNK
jgi:hypothetical protein